MKIMIISNTVLAAAAALALAGCNATSASELSVGTPGQITVPRTATPVPATGKLTVQMTSATLGDDCGQGLVPAPSSPMPIEKKSEGPAQKPSSTADASEHRGVAAARRACEQTSMQLSIIAPADALASELRVKSVEVYDDTGKLIGTLTARTPSVWAANGYTAWDQRIAPAQTLSVSYPLTQPDWSKVSSRYNKTYTLKAIVTVGGVDHPLERDVHVAGEARLPPGAVT